MSNARLVTVEDIERLQAERTLYRDALLSIRRQVKHWSDNNRGGLAIQRKRWLILDGIAREALANWDESVTESAGGVGEL